jgi:hypothetical protein
MKHRFFRQTILNLVMVIVGFCFTVSMPTEGATKDFPVETPMWVNYDYSTIPEDNLGFPDDGAAYWSTYCTIPEGARLELLGQYAHARYISINSYNGVTGAPTDALNDTEIVPDPGSMNPFIPGAKRAGDAKRNFTITILDDVRPETPVQNSLYARVGDEPGQEIALIWRVYVADKDRDKTGGVGLPVPRVTLTDGRVLEGDAAYAALSIRHEKFPIQPLVAKKYAPLRGSKVWGLNPATNKPLPSGVVGPKPEFFPAHNPADWMKVFNIPHSIVEWYYGLTLPDPAYFVGQYATLDNQYAVVHLNRGYGKIAVLRGKAPITPKTYNRVSLMNGNVDMRYWAITTNESFFTTKVVDSAYDEQVPLDDDGYYTIIVCLEEDLPGNATESNRVKWLNWGKNGDGFGNTDDGFLIFRNMLASPDFNHAVQNVTATGKVEEVMGEYLPTITYMSTEEFEALGDTPWKGLRQ